MGLGAGIGMGQMMAGMMQQKEQPNTTAITNDPMAKLQKLKQMLDAGLITVDEFDAKKKDILTIL